MTAARLRWILLALVALLAVFIRWPGFTRGGFSNHDVAGILYNGMLLADGRFPYVDSIEGKAPGTFYLAALLARGGRDIGAFQIWANLWAMASLCGVALISRRLWGPWGAVAAAGVYVLHDAVLDSQDANYVTWVQLPMIVSFGLSLEASQAGRRRRLWLWAGAGFALGLALLIKRPAGVMVPLLAAWALARGGTDLRGRGEALGAVAAGGVLAHLPIVVHYGAAGHLDALVSGYLFNEWAGAYLARNSLDLVEGMLATGHFVGPALFLAAFAVIPRRGDRGAEHMPWLLLWCGLALAGTFVGGRHFKGYFLAPAAPLAIVAAAPWGLLGTRPRGGNRARALLGVGLAFLLVRQTALIDKGRKDRRLPHDQGGKAIAKYIGKRLAPNDTIWVWGWHLWDVYPYTGRFSASRLYKSMGLLTPPTDGTWRKGSSRIKFVDGPRARMLLEDLEANRPGYIVLGSTVPRQQFVELRRFLLRNYQRDRKGPKIGKVQYWKRRDPT